MPFVFNGTSFTGPKQTPLGELFTSMFGQAAAIAPKAFEDARADDRFQQELKAKKDQYDQEMAFKKGEANRQEAHYQEGIADRDKGRKAFGSAMTEMMPGLGEKDRQMAKGQDTAVNAMGGVAGKVLGSAVGGPAMGQTMEGSLNHLGQYQKDFQQRHDYMQGLLSNMDERSAGPLVEQYLKHETKAKNDALSQHMVEVIDQKMRGYAMEQGGASQGIGPTEPGAADPTYQAALQQHMGHVQMLREALAQNLVQDPEKAMELLAQGEANLQVMKQRHRAAQNTAALYSNDVAALQEQLMNHRASAAHNGGHPSHQEYEDYLTDKITRSQTLLEDLAANPDMDLKEFRNEWNKIQDSYRPRMTDGPAQAKKGTSKVVSHANLELKWAEDDLKTLEDQRKGVLADGALDPKEQAAQVEELQAQIDQRKHDIEVNREIIRNTPDEEESPEQGAPVQGGTQEQLPPTVNPQLGGPTKPDGGQASGIPKEIIQQAHDMILSGDAGGLADLAAKYVPKGTPNREAVLQQVIEALTQEADSLVGDTMDKWSKSDSPSLRELAKNNPVANQRKASDEAQRKVATLASEHGFPVPKKGDRDSWIRAIEAAKAKQEQLASANDVDYTDSGAIYGSGRASMVGQAIEYLTGEYAQANNYAPATAADLHRIFVTGKKAESDPSEKEPDGDSDDMDFSLVKPDSEKSSYTTSDDRKKPEYRPSKPQSAPKETVYSKLAGAYSGVKKKVDSIPKVSEEEISKAGERPWWSSKNSDSGRGQEARFQAESRKEAKAMGQVWEREELRKQAEGKSNFDVGVMADEWASKHGISKKDAQEAVRKILSDEWIRKDVNERKRNMRKGTQRKD